MEPNSLYREILNNKFIEIKSRRENYSMRAFARDMELPASVMSQVLNGKRCIPLKSIPSIIQKLELPDDQRRAFLESLTQEKASIRNLLMTEDNIKFYTLDQKRDKKMIEEWEYAAFISLMDCADFSDDFAYCANKLNTTEERVKEVVADLICSGLVYYDVNMKLSKTHEAISTNSDNSSESHKKSHLKSLELAQQALNSVSLDKRSYASGTFAISEEDLPELKKIVYDFHIRLNKYLANNKKSKDSVYHISTQFFPISKGS